MDKSALFGDTTDKADQSGSALNTQSRYQSEKALFLQLLELDDVQRAHALAQLKEDDHALAVIMERRLALNQSQMQIPSEVSPALPQFGRYRAVREIGRGGMGRVWLAERADAVDKQLLAIKQLREECIDKDLQQRFESERRILARLDHPGIVPLLDTGVDSKGYPYLVTPYIEGQAIDVYCREQRLNLRSRVRLVRDMVEALIHAHQQLIVHRDLKPANVLVEKNARVRLLDFGIAKVLGDGGIETNAGSSMMTLRYAAPEQISGGAITVGCDLYAVGVMLFELIGGVRISTAAPNAASIAVSIRPK